MTEVLFKITNKSLEAMSREQLESAVSQTVLELDQKGKDGLNFNEFEQILLPILKVLDKDNQLLVTRDRDFHDEKEKLETKYTEANLNLMRVSELKSK